MSKTINYDIPLSVSGKKSWTSLPDDILNKAGKVIVSEDPDLSLSTISKLEEVHAPDTPAIFNFGYNDESDTGCVSVAVCISENVYATMAELTARYASLRKIPFLTAAKALIELREKKGLCRLDINGNGQIIYKQWTPYVVNPSCAPRHKSTKNTLSANPDFCWDEIAPNAVNL